MGDLCRVGPHHAGGRWGAVDEASHRSAAGRVLVVFSIVATCVWPLRGAIAAGVSG
jgi:hypothetical protein